MTPMVQQSLLLPKALEAAVVALGHMTVTEAKLRAMSGELSELGYKRVYDDRIWLTTMMDLTKSASISNDPDVIFSALAAITPEFEDLLARAKKYEKILEDIREGTLRDKSNKDPRNERKDDKRYMTYT